MSTDSNDAAREREPFIRKLRKKTEALKLGDPRITREVCPSCDGVFKNASDLAALKWRKS